MICSGCKYWSSWNVEQPIWSLHEFGIENCESGFDWSHHFLFLSFCVWELVERNMTPFQWRGSLLFIANECRLRSRNPIDLGLRSWTEILDLLRFGFELISWMTWSLLTWSRFALALGPTIGPDSYKVFGLVRSLDQIKVWLLFWVVLFLATTILSNPT